MEELKISEMVEAENVNEEDLVMIVQNGVNKKVKAKNIKANEPSQESITSLLQLVFPIGSTYITQDRTNPNSILGFGTWERLKGKVCLGLDEDDRNMNVIGETGGEKTHVLTIDESPKHTHRLPVSTTSGDYLGAHDFVQYGGYQNGTTEKNGSWYSSVEDTGGNKAHNNMPPYEIVGFMWIRRS